MNRRSEKEVGNNANMPPYKKMFHEMKTSPELKSALRDNLIKKCIIRFKESRFSNIERLRKVSSHLISSIHIIPKCASRLLLTSLFGKK